MLKNGNSLAAAEFPRILHRQLCSAGSAAHKNSFRMYPGASLWQDSILRKQVKISTCPCVEKPARADSVSHFKTVNEILTPLFNILC